MDLHHLLRSAQDAMTVARVYGEPYQHGAVTVIPAAAVAGGGGGGSGDREDEQGEGGGYGLRARPAGAFVITDDALRWRPAVDVNRLAATLASVAVTAMLCRAWVERARLRRAAD